MYDNFDNYGKYLFLIERNKRLLFENESFRQIF